MMNIEIGTKVEGNWGAMIPMSFGEVVSIVDNKVVVAFEDDEDGEMMHHTTVENIHPKGWRSVNGSPIGVFVSEE
jgi:hypothetical protein